MIAEEFGHLRQKTDLKAMPVLKIFTLHSFHIFTQDLTGKAWTYSECTIQNVCTTCQIGDATVLQMVLDVDDIKSSEKLKISTIKVIRSRQIKVAVTNPNDDDATCPGHIVWSLHGCIWYLAQVCALAEAPDILKAQFQNNTRTKFVVLWYGDGLYSLVSKVENLV